MEYKAETKGFARVLDPATLAGELADIESDTAALDASTKEFYAAANPQGPATTPPPNHRNRRGCGEARPGAN